MEEKKDKKPNKKLRKLGDSKQAKQLIEAQITVRFIEEVHLCEKEGRVYSRPQLEDDLLLYQNGISDMRAGRYLVSVVNIQRLKTKYNGDIQYVLFGVRDREHSGVMKGGIRINIHKPYEFPYRKPFVLKELAFPITSQEDAEDSNSESQP